MGALSAVLAGACVAPVLLAVLALAGGLYGAGLSAALILPFLLGLGMALPWPLLAAGLTVLPKPGAWMSTVKKIFGSLILLLAVYYAWNAFRAVRPNAAEEAPLPGFHRMDLGRDDAGEWEALLLAALENPRPVLIEFTARWCKVCHWMNATVLRDDAVQRRLQDMSAIQFIADHPERSPADEMLRTFGISGYPAFILIPAADAPPEERALPESGGDAPAP
jgi:thiol:disulfide interchange protein